MKKIKVITIISGIILTIILVLGSSYALFYSESNFTNEETYTTGILDIELVNEEGYNTSLTLSNSLPLTDEKGKQTTPFKLKLKNNGNLSYTFDLKLINNTKENNLDTNYLKIMIDNDNPVKYNTLNDGIIKSNITLNPNKEIVIEVRLWLDENTPNSQIGKTFSGKLTTDGVGKEYIDLSRTSSEMLAYLGLTVNDGTPDFSQAATTDEGIYAAEDDYGTSYYFRGAVENNYVKFADKYWRIIRINGDGTIRLIYDGTSAHANDEVSDDRQIGTSDYANDFMDNAYVGYMYGQEDASSYEETHANINDSHIKTAVDNWYKINIQDAGYGDKVADVIYCNDRSIYSGYGYGENMTYYGAYNRISNENNPILTCTNKNDRFTVSDTVLGNGALTYPVGLITADEMSMAGGVYWIYSSCYLCSGSYFTMTPRSYSPIEDFGFLFSYESNMLLFNNYTVSLGVRPVISLKSSVELQGQGTMEDPFVVK